MFLCLLLLGLLVCGVYLFIVQLPVLVRGLLSRFVLGCFLFTLVGVTACMLIVLIVVVISNLDVVLC